MDEEKGEENPAGPKSTNPDNISFPWFLELVSTADLAPRDPVVMTSHPSVTDMEIMAHHNMPAGSGKSHGHRSSSEGKHHHSSRGGGKTRQHRHRHGKHRKSSDGSSRPVTPPAQRVQMILGEDYDDSGHETRPLFSEMEELFHDENTGQSEWKETARWVKFEEDVEEGGNRWSKPHVATLSLHSLFELRSMMLNGTVWLDLSVNNLEDLSDLVLDNMINANVLHYEKKCLIKELLLKKHRHQHENQRDSRDSNGTAKPKMRMIRSLADIGRIESWSKSTPHMKGGLSGNPGGSEEDSQKKLSSVHKSTAEGLNSSMQSSASSATKMNTHFMKKLPKGTEASNILVAELDFLDKPISAFVRLNEPVFFGDLTEVPIPTRFIFMLLGPGGESNENASRYHEIGRAIATMLADEVFQEVAFKAKRREHLLAGIDEFLDAVTVLPPGEWDPNIRIEPPQSVPPQDNRKHPKQVVKVDEEEEEAKQRTEAGLVRTGRLFGGLVNDIKRKTPFYWSDFKDAFAMQSVASYIFIYFACLTPIITFGGLLGDATHDRIASIESLVSGMIVGISYGLFSGQPLTILGSTGPILVFETILYDICDSFGWQYLSFRLWVGIWVGIILFLVVAFDFSAYVCYITRFTEENFATLIAVIFIKKAIEKVIHISALVPIHESECFCKANSTYFEQYGTSTEFTGFNQTKPYIYPCSFEADGVTIQGLQSPGCHYVPNAFMMSLLLFIGTFLISSTLKNFRSASFFPDKVRQSISDFAVIVAILSMTLLDFFMAVDTPKLNVPESLRPTWPEREWLIPLFDGNPIYSAFAAFIPALVATILIFMDQQITAVIVNRKEHKLIKGGGYHLDLLIVTILIVVCSIFGLPWFVAATVLSINHVKSLTRESECSAPGEKPQFLGIREQRVTHVLIFFTIGMSVFMVPVLSKIPMPVLYGVFLYMGVASLNGLQFFDRILLFFMPKKYQPDLPYLRQVPLVRVHIFTFIQLLCLVGLWVVKDIKATSILFPVMLVVMIAVRKLLDFVFSKEELKALDDILPEFKRKQKLQEKEVEAEGGENGDAGMGGIEADALGMKNRADRNRRTSLSYNKSSIEIPLASGNVMKIPVVDSDINISEEVNKSGVWKSVDQNSQNVKKRNRKMSIVPENKMGEDEEDDDAGIHIKLG